MTAIIIYIYSFKKGINGPAKLILYRYLASICFKFHNHHSRLSHIKNISPWWSPPTRPHFSFHLVTIHRTSAGTAWPEPPTPTTTPAPSLCCSLPLELQRKPIKTIRATVSSLTASRLTDQGLLNISTQNFRQWLARRVNECWANFNEDSLTFVFALLACGAFARGRFYRCCTRLLVRIIIPSLQVWHIYRLMGHKILLMEPAKCLDMLTSQWAFRKHVIYI